MNYIVDDMGQVVDKLRKTGSFTVDSYANGVYTLISKNSLIENEWVNIDGSEYKVTGVTSGQFQIETPDSIVDGTYKTLSPYYMYGHRLEISNRLLEKDEDQVFKYQKYPLIALRLPITEDNSKRMFPGLSLNMAIMDFTNKDYNSEERYENVIKPILTPLYKDFMHQLKVTKYFTSQSYEHDKVDQLFWGTQYSEGNSKYIFNDPLDAIELINLSLNHINNKN